MTGNPIHNRTGLAAIAHRVATHRSLLAAAKKKLSAHPALDPLTARDTDDFSIALLDGWACLGEVLSFYTERLANEGYLRTATDPESIRLLGRLVGHEPRPSVGASAYLSYTVSDGADTVIEAGNRATSSIGQPQTFETSTALRAKGDWNDLGVRRFQPRDLDVEYLPSLPQIEIDGVDNNVTGGNRLLFDLGVGNDPILRVAVDARPQPELGYTVIDFQPPNPLRDYEFGRAALVSALAEAQDVTTTFSTKITTELVRPLMASVPETEPQDLRPKLRTALKQLPEILAIGRAGTLGPASWLEQVAELLDAAHNALRLAAVVLGNRYPDAALAAAALDRPPARPAAVPDRPVARPAAAPERPVADECPPPTRPEDRPETVEGLAGLLPALRTPPSQPPPDPADLDRSVATAFKPASDTGVRVLTAADPGLADTLYRAWAGLDLTPPSEVERLWVFRSSCSPFGLTLPVVPRPSGDLADDSDVRTYSPVGASALTELALDAQYDTIAPDSWLVLENGPLGRLIVKVTKVDKRVVRLDDHSATVTVLTLAKPWRAGNETVEKIRPTAVRFQAESLTIVGDPITGDIAGDRLELDRLHQDLTTGRWLIVSGERADLPNRMRGVPAAELVMIGGVQQGADVDIPGERPHTTVVLAVPLAYRYHRATVRVQGNVVEATQGETRAEVLGSGDATVPNQRFTVRGNPITWLPSETPLGASTTLAVRVGGVRWTETELLSDLGPTDLGYAAKPAADGSTAVTFGDGRHGARVPTGAENVTAGYRVGAGEAGNVPAGKIDQVATRPAGVDQVVNPIQATGGAAADGPADARRVTPLRTMALDRLVSVADYQHFTQARAGIGKASATALSDGRREVVHVTIAGVRDAPIAPHSGLFRTLAASLTRFGELNLPVTLATRELTVLVLSAGVRVRPEYEWPDVERKLRARLLEEFGFAARELAQPAHLSEVVAVMQAVDGVDHLDVDAFAGVPHRIGPKEIGRIADLLNQVQDTVPATPARLELIEHEVTYQDTLTSIADKHTVSLDQLAALNPGLTGIDPVDGTKLLVRQEIRPAQLAVFTPDVPDTLILRRL
ncbi:putative baseplate assembly protein [Crossiella sp. NPDC003009]